MQIALNCSLVQVRALRPLKWRREPFVPLSDRFLRLRIGGELARAPVYKKEEEEEEEEKASAAAAAAPGSGRLKEVLSFVRASGKAKRSGKHHFIHE